MGGAKRAGGQRSGLYSSQRLTNWRPYDPFYAEASSLPPRLKPQVKVAISDETPLAIYERPLASCFVRPCSVDDVAQVIKRVPARHLSGLTGVYLMGGTAAQMRSNRRTFGQYHTGERRIYLYPVPAAFLTGFSEKTSRPSDIQGYLMAGATVTSRAGANELRFDADSLRVFYLYDVLLHEIGHHVDEGRREGEVERFAEWFSEYQRSKLLHRPAGDNRRRVSLRTSRRA
jgi:hypothetical protein